MPNELTKLPLIIIAAYRIYPERLFESVESSGRPVAWHIHYHGPDAGLATKLQAFAGPRPNATLFDHRANRGLSRSWNDSLRLLPKGEHDVAFLINDDLEFLPGGFARFLSFVENHERQNNGAALYTVVGQESGGDLNGTFQVQNMSCCALNRSIIETVGYFDEAFVPAYYEDCDYMRRMRLENVPFVIEPDPLCVHERSSTLRGDEVLRAQAGEWFERNKAYYVRKWGGEPLHESFAHPFGPEIQGDRARLTDADFG